MSQISPPVRIVAVVAVAFLAIYMAVLRPKSSTPPAPPAATPTGNVNTGKPAVTQFGKAVEAAKGAAKKTEDQARRDAGESASKSGSSASSTATRSGSAAATAPAVAKVDVAGLPRPVARAVRQDKVLALLFWNGRSADDRAVHSALRHVQRFDGAVFVHTAPLKKIARYGRITRGADVQQSPTVVVVDRKLRATTLVGYVDVDTIDQAVVDALRSSGGIFVHDSYRRSLNKMCSSVVHDIYAIPEPTSLPQARRYLHRATDRLDAFTAGVRGLAAPKPWRSFKHATLADLAVASHAYRDLAHDLRGHPSRAKISSTFQAFGGKVGPAGKRLDKRMDRNGLIFCGSRN